MSVVIEAIESLGLKVSVAEGFDQSKEALTVFRPHLLVADVRLGAFNGLHVIIRAKAAAADIAAILMLPAPDPVLVLATDALPMIVPASDEELAWLIRAAACHVA